MDVREVERSTGLSRANIRFYEKEGLIEPRRRENGYRDYSPEDVKTLLRVKLLRRLMISVEEIRSLQEAREDLGALLDRKMEELRRNEPCFGPDARVTTWDTLTPKVFAIRRTWEERELVCLANFSGECQQAHLPSLSGTYQDLFTGETFAPQAVPLAPYQYRWMAKG